MQRYINVLDTILVLLLSLLLLGCVGLGEAYRTYPRFQLDTFATQNVASNSNEIEYRLPLHATSGRLTSDTTAQTSFDTSVANDEIHFFESVSFVYDYAGKPVRKKGQVSYGQ